MRTHGSQCRADYKDSAIERISKWGADGRRVTATSALLLTGALLMPTGSAAQPPSTATSAASPVAANERNIVRNGGSKDPP